MEFSLSALGLGLLGFLFDDLIFPIGCALDRAYYSPGAQRPTFAPAFRSNGPFLREIDRAADVARKKSPFSAA